MSVKNVKMYFLEVENQYMEMLDLLKEVDPLVTSGEMSEDAYHNVVKEVEKLRENYERLAYIMFLLGIRNKHNDEEKEKDKYWYQALKTSSKEFILNENKDVLSHIKKLIKNKEIGDFDE